MRKLFIIAAAFLVMVPGLVHAAESRADRPHWSLELKGGAFFPDAANWSKFYGSSFMGEYAAALSYKLHRQVEAGVEASYARATGKGLQPIFNSDTPTGNVTYEQVPLNLFVLARGVFDENQWLVPYAGGGWTRLFYRERVKGQGKTEGSVNGYHARAGVQLLLDRFESGVADDLFLDSGIYNTYFFLEGKYTDAKVDTIPAGSVNLGGASCLGGFLFEF